MHEDGRSAGEIYLEAKKDGLNQIEVIRLLRTVCSLSLAETKRITGELDILNRRQDLKPGKLVYWEGSSSDEGLFLMQARVIQVQNGNVWLAEHKKFRATKEGLEEVALNGAPSTTIPVSYFERTLAERLGEAIEFWLELARVREKRSA